MAKNTKKAESKTKKAAPKAEKETPEPQTDGNEQAQQLVIHTQYIKDFSFENPGAPKTMTERSGQPEIQINVNVAATPLNEERLFEVVLSLRATASLDSKDIFIVELDYAGIMSVAQNVADNVLHPIIMIEGPRMIFPFARAILSEITQAGGFMPLNIQPIDFVRVYQQGINAQKQEKT
jgi:preprotein translocase subunit SecB